MIGQRRTKFGAEVFAFLDWLLDCQSILIHTTPETDAKDDIAKERQMGVLSGCTPRPEVLKGDLDDAIFAADFGDVISGKAPDVYRTPGPFFRNTHPAQQLRKIVEAVFGRLADPTEGGATIRLSTGFGGGKSHTLIALWHLAKNIGNVSLGTELLPAAGRPKQVTVVAVDAGKAGLPIFAAHDDIEVHSLWGEVFHGLGGRAAVAKLGAADNPEASPSEDQIAAVLPSGPLLFLLDELVIYLAKLSERGQGNLLGFISSLAAVVSKRPQSVLIVTDPADQRAYAKEAAKLGDAATNAAIRLDDLLGRRVTDFDPIGNEAARVIVRRLFDNVDMGAAQQVSALYHDLYQRVHHEQPGTIPVRATTTDYAKRFVECYPFHPRLLETAQDRLSALSDFQKSRGVLRLFARILRDTWESQQDVEVISAGELDWSSPRIRADLLQRLNRDAFRGAADADVARHAGELDGGALRDIHRRVASALLLESIPLQANSGLDAAEATLAVLRPDEAGHEPGEALDRLAGACWHIYPLPGGHGWQFRYEENIIKQIEEQKGRYVEEAKDLVRAEAQQYFKGPQFTLRPWPSSAQQVSPSADLQLALCDSEELARRVCAYEDESDPSAPMPRLFRNAIVAVAPTTSALDVAVERAQRLIAAERIEREHQNQRSDASRLAREQLQRIVPELRKQFRVQVYRSFDRIVLASGQVYRLEEPLQLSDEDLLKIPQGQPILMKFLEEKNLIYGLNDALDADLFLSNVLPGATPVSGQPDVYTTKAVHERFLAAPGLRLIRGPGVIRQTILKALGERKVVVRLADARAYDAEGCVSGPAGARRRVPGALMSLKLDDTEQIARADSEVASDWVREDAVTPPNGAPGGDATPPTPPPPPPGPVRATSWEKVVEYAVERPLIELKLTARKPIDAAQLTALAQPLGPESLALDVTVNGSARDGGGQISFAVASLKPTHAIKPLQIAQTLFNALADGATYEALLTLRFGTGRTDMHEQLQALADSAPADVTPQATFEKPSVSVGGNGA